jgi:hypothetical protein
MKELIINIDDPGERAWDGSPKTFEIQELVRCKDCKWWHESKANNGFGDCGQANGITLKSSDWFCADGERKSE